MAERLSSTIAQFADCFRLKTQSVLPQAELYLHGLVQADRKNIERMAEVVVDANYQQSQHFLTYSPWPHLHVMDKVAKEADMLLGGHDDTCLLLDDTGHVKKGLASVGVARQWCGRLGKVDNCQVAVCAVLCRQTRHTLIDTRLYLPKAWVDDPARCRKAGVPDADIVMRSKAEHALDMVHHARALGVRFQWVGMDAGYGKEPWLLRALDAAGETFVADVHKHQRIYLADPKPHLLPRTSKRGRAPTRLRAETEAIRVDQWVKQQPEQAWKTLTLRDSTRGKLRVESLHQRVWLWDGAEPSPHCWHLIVRREVGSPKTIKYSLSNAPEDTSHQRLVVMQGARFWVERSFQDAKSECGMADYQVRRWSAWHHHMAMVMIAMLFLLKERIRQKDTSPLLSCGDIVDLLKAFLPRRTANEDDLLELIRQRHRRRQAAIESALRQQARSLQSDRCLGAEGAKRG